MNRPADKTETHFEEPGSLRKPGVVGRIVRLLFGVILLQALWQMLTDGASMVSLSVAPRGWSFWFFVAIAFHITPYVVNIGFSRNWRRKPQVFIAAAAGALIAVDFAVYGTWWAPPLGTFVWIWLVYFSAHLGFSFVLSTILGTPGCEMRAIPHLWTILSGRSTKEHYCPGPFDGIDKWEVDRKRA